MEEQTPITAEDFLETSIAPNECRFGAEAVDYCYTTDEVQYHMEQYAQAKVLEALEREQEDLDFIYSLLPKWTKEVPKGYGEMFYGTLSYEGDLKVKERVDKILRNRSKTKL